MNVDNPKKGHWRLYAGNKFIHLLTALLALFLATPLLDALIISLPMASLLLLLALITSLRAMEAQRNTILFCLSIYLFIITVEFLIKLHWWILPLPALLSIILLSTALFLVIAIRFLSGRVFRARRVTTDTVVGGICIYFLIGYFFACLYYVFLVLNPESFQCSTKWNSLHLVYFSFTTLTTLGYGDVIPLDRMVMVISNLQAITGQIYLGIFVARLVGLHIIHESSAGKD